MKGPRPGASRAVMLLALVFVAAIVLLSGLLIWQGYTETLERARTRAQTASHIVAVHAQWLLEASTQALRRIDDSLGSDIALSVLAPGDIREAVSDLPAEVEAAVFDAAGQSRLSSFAPGDALNVADRDYFAALAAGEQWHVSKLIVDRKTKVPVFVVAHRLERDGQFAGVAAIYVYASVMEGFWASLDLGPNSTVSLIRDDGWLVARYPSLTESFDMSSYELFTQHLPASPAGTYTAAASPADGISRIVGYWSVPTQKVVAIASVATQTILAQFWRGVTIFLTLLLPILTALLFGAWWLSRSLKRIEQSRAALALALEENTMLFREIHHRVKNNLQAVSSLVQLQPLPVEAKKDMAQRIAAMVAVHEHIYRSDQFASVETADYVRIVVNGLRDGYGSKVEVRYALEPVTVDKDQAMPLGLIVNEVVSNAFKHAFTDGRDGRVAIELSDLGGGRGRLTVTDNGVGFDGAAKSNGMGRRLIEGLTRQMGGTYRFTSDSGSRFELEFPTVAGA